MQGDYLKLRRVIIYVLCIPKTILFNFHYFKFKDAIKFPVIISHRVKLLNIKGKVELTSPAKFGMIKIGVTDHMFSCDKGLRSLWNVEGKVILGKNINIGNGAKIRVLGRMQIGNEFCCNGVFLLDCKKNIEIGNDVLVGWNCTIMDTDNHYIFNNKKEIINPIEKIYIGNKVWIAANCSVKKGAKILDETVIASNSLISKEAINGNCVIAGSPAKVVKNNISWNK